MARKKTPKHQTAEFWHKIADLPADERTVFDGGSIPEKWIAYQLDTPGLLMTIGLAVIGACFGFGGLAAMIDTALNAEWSRALEYYEKGDWGALVIGLAAMVVVIFGIAALLWIFYANAYRTIVLLKHGSKVQQDRLLFGFLLTETHALLRNPDWDDWRIVLRVPREAVRTPELVSRYQHAAHTNPRGLSPGKNIVNFRFNWLEFGVEVSAFALRFGDPLTGIEEWRKGG